jgi:hypothetical protein
LSKNTTEVRAICEAVVGDENDGWLRETGEECSTLSKKQAAKGVPSVNSKSEQEENILDGLILPIVKETVWENQQELQ